MELAPEHFKERELKAFGEYRKKCPVCKDHYGTGTVCYGKRIMMQCLADEKTMDACPYWYSVRVAWGWI